jgi:ribosomal-protein-alanine N-acetyltransferase
MQIRKATLSDLHQVSSIEAVSHTTPWSLGDFTSELQRPDAEFWLICDENNRVQGYIIFRLILNECYLINITVADGRRRRGIGSLLMQHMIIRAGGRGCDRIVLDVRRDNAAALAFYEEWGFEPAGGPGLSGSYVMTKNI